MNEAITKYNIGDIVSAKITNIVAFGAFAQLPNGQSGLIHISEISDSFIANIHNFLKEDQNYNVIIIAYGDKPNTYQLSLKKAFIKRPRQNIVLNRKPLTRKQINVAIIKKYSFENSKSVLNSQIEKEYERLGKKNG